MEPLRRFGFFRDQLIRMANGRYTLFADAQATIAALQARVKELEESRDAWKASQECSEKAYMSLVNQIPAERFDYDPVNVALLDGAKEQEVIGRRQIADLQSQLTQRTAELEAAKADKAKWEEIASLRFAGDHKFVKEMELLKIENANLQAELERVRDQYADPRKMVLALPKVEGEIEYVSGMGWIIKHNGDVRAIPDLGRGLVAALLQHRQGMEG